MCESFYDVWEWKTVEWKLVRARKSHGCEACFAKILPGQLHRVCRGLYDGQWSGGRRCLRCDAIAEAMSERGCIVDFDMGEEMGERAEDYYPHVPETEPICELPFLSYEELEERALKG